MKFYYVASLFINEQAEEHASEGGGRLMLDIYVGLKWWRDEVKKAKP